MSKDKIKTVLHILIAGLATIMLSFIGTDCKVMAEGGTFTVTYHAGEGGEFEGGGTENVVTYALSLQPLTRFSHTSNVDDTGLQTGNYGGSWTNANITGTDRGDISKAHVVTIPDASTLTVDLYYNGEDVNYDWVSVWSGSHPAYTAASNRTSTGYVTTANGAPNNNNRFGGSQSGSYSVNGNSLTNMGHVTLTIAGDTVTFAFKSDSSGYGNGYGYYAVVTGADSDGNPVRNADVISGEYKDPAKPETDTTQFFFKNWNTASDGSGETATAESLLADGDLYATYEEVADIDNGTFGCPWRIKADGTLEIGKDGEDCTLANTERMSMGDWPWYTNRYKITSAVVKGSVKSADGSLAGMFAYQDHNTSIDLSGFDTSNGMDFASMFNNCKSLTSLDLGDKFDTSSGTVFRFMFCYCSSLTSLDLKDKFDTSNGTQFNEMFHGCSSLTSLDLGNKFDTSNGTDFSSMFCDCKSVSSLDLGDKFDTSKGTVFEQMFYGCKSLSSLDLGDKFDTSSGTNFKTMFYACDALTSLDLGDKFDTSNGTSFRNMFLGCSSLDSLDLGDKFDTSKGTDFASMFSGCSSLTSLDLGDKFDTSKGTTFEQMFSGCGLSSLDLGDKFDTSKGTNFHQMFSSCDLASLDLGDKFDTSNGTAFTYMFSSCSSLASLDLGNMFDTSHGTSFNSMFYGCSSLTSLDLGDKFDTSNGANFSNMFNGCKALSSLDLGDKFDTSKGTNFSWMFLDCSSLESLDLSTFDTSAATDMASMFGRMHSLKSIYLPSTFSFSGKNITTSRKALLPTPQQPSTGWVQYYDDHTQKIVKGSSNILTAEELRDTWNPDTMSGLWIWNETDPTSQGYGVSTKQRSDDPKWEQLDETTWKYVFDVFDDSIPYYLTEEPMDGFTSDIDPEKGYVEVINKKAEITNTTTRARGDLTVRKVVAGTETNEKFDFTISLSGVGIKTEGTQAIGNLIFINGVTHVQLGDGESITIEGLPEGVTYTVTEDNILGNYEMTCSNDTGTIVKEGNTALFTNTKKEVHEDPEYADLRLEKLTANADELDEGKEYPFNILFTGLVPNTTYKIQSDKIETHQNMNMSFKADTYGDASVSVFLWDTEILTFKDLPKDSTYKITEPEGDWISSYRIVNADANGIIAKDRDENLVKNTALSTETESVDTNEQTTVTFTNTYRDTETLKVQKVVEDDEADNTKFEFHVSFTDMKEGDVIMSSIGRITADEDGMAEREFYLSAGEEVSFEDIPVSAKYQITEVANIYKASYTVTDSSDTYLVKRIENAEGSNAAANQDLSTAVETVNKGEDITVLFTNSKETGSLKITKTGSEAIDENEEFIINVTVMGSRFPITGTFDMTGTEAESIELDKNGHGTVALKKGQSVTISGLPIDSTYTIDEEDPAEQFEKTYTNETGTISAALSEAEVHNDIPGAEITIKKIVNGTLLGRSQVFTFEIELKENNEPFVGELETEGTDITSLTFGANGKASFTLKHGQELKIKGVPIGASYSVTEANYESEGYITSSEGATGTADQNSSANKVTFANAKYIKLPNAASVTPVMFYGIGALLIAGGLLIVLRRKKSEKTNNEEESQ